MGINMCLLMSNHYSLMFSSKRQSMLYSHEYVMTILSVQISKGVHSKKLILDTCTKTAFSFNNNIIYKQKDGVSMGSSLGPIIPSRPNPGRSEKN